MFMTIWLQKVFSKLSSDVFHPLPNLHCPARAKERCDPGGIWAVSHYSVSCFHKKCLCEKKRGTITGEIERQGSSLSPSVQRLSAMACCLSLQSPGKR